MVPVSSNIPPTQTVQNGADATDTNTSVHLEYIFPMPSQLNMYAILLMSFLQDRK